MRVAFIGLGNMGKPMSRNLITAGHTVHGFDISPDACAYLAQQGGAVAARASDAVRDVDLVISMLPTGEHVRDLYFGSGDIVAHLSPGTLLIDSSTISIAVTRDLAARVKASGFSMIDAP
ncbi:MAG: NAD(P)-binding domain-containing protein, partial [Alphaproteobacteria bacterium]|nr:NAD(P)-binding domain-containing protein [Alphaproteobacteria bacterium]